MYSAQNLAALFLDKISLESCVLVSVMDDNMIFILPEQWSSVTWFKIWVSILVSANDF